jgi:hypothetical protein
VRLITFRNKPRDPTREESREEIGALTDSTATVIRLQAAEELRRGRSHPHLASMMAFLEGGAAARETAQASLDFALARIREKPALLRIGDGALPEGRR